MTKILTSHVGSLPRTQDVVDFIFARENGESYDQAAFDNCMSSACNETVRRQVEAGHQLAERFLEADADVELLAQLGLVHHPDGTGNGADLGRGTRGHADLHGLQLEPPGRVRAAALQQHGARIGEGPAQVGAGEQTLQRLLHGEMAVQSGAAQPLQVIGVEHQVQIGLVGELGHRTVQAERGDMQFDADRFGGLSQRGGAAEQRGEQQGTVQRRNMTAHYRGFHVVWQVALLRNKSRSYPRRNSRQDLAAACRKKSARQPRGAGRTRINQGSRVICTGCRRSSVVSSACGSSRSKTPLILRRRSASSRSRMRSGR